MTPIFYLIAPLKSIRNDRFVKKSLTPTHDSERLLLDLCRLTVTATQKVRMLRCASSFPCFRRGRLIAAYATVRHIMETDFKSVPARALPADFLRSRPQFKAFGTFYESVIPEK